MLDLHPRFAPLFPIGDGLIRIYAGAASLYDDASRVDEMLYAQQEVLGELFRRPSAMFDAMMPHELLFTDVMALVRARTREDLARALRAKSRLGRHLVG